jgi:DNA mismatch endonuclease, patch repair protein
MLYKIGFRFRKHMDTVPGMPDIVFSKERLAVFIDGDFWHEYRLKFWKSKLSRFWAEGKCREPLMAY